MFWATLWALVLGFGLSGAVQAFVSRSEMDRRLGRGGPREIGRATLFGAASSSCSYAASAMAKTLFQRGADFVNSMVFMFASTNLVVELGIVLWVLMGWQFALAEFVGGAIMIVLFVLLARVALRRRETEAARARLGGGGHEHGAGASRGSWRERLSSPAGWADAASYTFADAKMLRKEMAAGYLVAGFLAVLVPVSVWNDVFLTGHGFWTSLQNVIVGPFIAIISFVCSVGNVPLAAALWLLLRSVGAHPDIVSIVYLGGTAAVGAIVAVLFVFAPSGLGPREASMYGLMLAVATPAQALGAVALNRVALTLVELLVLVVGGVLLRGAAARERAEPAELPSV